MRPRNTVLQGMYFFYSYVKMLQNFNEKICFDTDNTFYVFLIKYYCLRAPVMQSVEGMEHALPVDVIAVKRR
jgi:hypothetical protein